MSIKKVFPRMKGYRPPPTLAEESLLSFDQMRRKFGSTDRELERFLVEEGEQEEEPSASPT